MRLLLALLLAANANAEICRFAAKDKENPFKRWLASGEVICNNEPAPAGDWNVFARSADGVSTGATLEPQPAAHLAVTLRPGQRGVVYSPKYAFGYPVDSADMLVPAGTELWLFVLDKNVPVGVFTITPIEAGIHRTIDARVAPPPTVVGWILVPQSDRAALTKARGPSRPSLRVAKNDATTAPVELLNGSFFLAREVPAGDAPIQLGGRGWIPSRSHAEVKGAFTAGETPLIAQPSATLIVNWSGVGDVAAMNASVGECGGTEGAEAKFDVEIARCTAGDPPVCNSVRHEIIPAGTTFGTVTADDIPAGTYRAQLSFGHLPPVSATATIAAGEIANRSIQAHYLELYGGLTLGGKPLDDDAMLKLPGGIGFSARGSGEYRGAIIDRFPLAGVDTRIDIAGCGGKPKAFVLTDRPIRRNTRFDIDIPDNEVTVSVIDTFTHETISGAMIKYAFMSLPVPRRAIVTGTAQTSSDGPFRMRFVPEREIRISVSAPGYQKNDVPPFSITKAETKSIEVQLVPLRGTQAKIVSPTPFDNATVMWFGPTGAVDETTELSMDGTFMYSGTHDGALMAIVSASHPLWLTRMPNVRRRETFEMRFPAAPSRTFDVAYKRGDTRIARYVGLMIAGVHVPPAALQLHQSLRNTTPLLRGSGPLHIADILETGPIDVLLGPNVEEVASRVRAVDLFTLPQFAEVPRQRLVAGAVSVVFE